MLAGCRACTAAAGPPGVVRSTGWSWIRPVPAHSHTSVMALPAVATSGQACDTVNIEPSAARRREPGAGVEIGEGFDLSSHRPPTMNGVAGTSQRQKSLPKDNLLLVLSIALSPPISVPAFRCLVAPGEKTPPLSGPQRGRQRAGPPLLPGLHPWETWCLPPWCTPTGPQSPLPSAPGIG